MYDGNKDNGAGQREAYERRHEIKPGDKFLWHFKAEKPGTGGFKGGYCTSGRLPKDFMYTLEDFTGDRVLTVIAMKEGRNWFGDFVDYWLNESGEWDGTFHQKRNHAYIINGVDAFKMERVSQ